MNLLELKTLLNKFTDLELENGKITSSIDIGCCGDIESLEIDFAEIFVEKDQIWLQIRHLNTLPGFESCRRVAQTFDLHKQYLESKK